MRRGVFGGSFDPIHFGHLLVARAAAEALELSRVHFVVASRQPLKQGDHAASPGERLAMVRLAVAADPRFVADDREVRRGGVSYTVDTLRELRHEFPHDSLCLLVGADAAQELPAWREAAVLPALAEIVVLTRAGARPSKRLEGGRVVVVPAVQISATDIRERVGAGRSVAGLVPPAVERYIRDRALYSGGRRAAAMTQEADA